MVWTPSDDGTLHAIATLELTSHAASRECDDFGVGREAKTDQLAGRQSIGQCASILRRQTGEPLLFFTPNHPILHAIAHPARRHQNDDERQGNEYLPHGIERRCPHETDSGHDDVDSQNRKCEEMDRREKPTMGRVTLCRLTHTIAPERKRDTIIYGPRNQR